MVSIPISLSLYYILHFAHVLTVCALEIIVLFVLTLTLLYCLVDTLLSSGTTVVADNILLLILQVSDTPPFP